MLLWEKWQNWLIWQLGRLEGKVEWDGTSDMKAKQTDAIIPEDTSLPFGCQPDFSSNT